MLFPPPRLLSNLSDNHHHLKVIIVRILMLPALRILLLREQRLSEPPNLRAKLEATLQVGRDLARFGLVNHDNFLIVGNGRGREASIELASDLTS